MRQAFWVVLAVACDKEGSNGLEPQDVCDRALEVVNACASGSGPTTTTGGSCTEALEACSNDDLAVLMDFYGCFANDCFGTECLDELEDLSPECLGTTGGSDTGRVTYTDY